MRFSTATLFLGLSTLAWADSHNYLSLYDNYECSGSVYAEIGVYTNDACFDQIPTGGDPRSVKTVLIENRCHKFLLQGGGNDDDAIC
ncbi:Uncharacterized protein TCAP_02251 [Tolypocladium capitatum]|uniref:Uncharacterized protein n=1 Tax=Tolypocladium capitatum TaxID=45235 RepID=A0A2K3QJV3_9HYPO|nr:Uncharacterized protein TCAP_02251 [Tolypocladium capitatum]